MSSYCYGGQVEMKPVVEENVGGDFMQDEGYPYAIPKVYLDGCGEVYNRQYCFNWDDDSVVMVRDKHVLRYTHSSFVELLAKNEEGNIVWMDGRNAPYSDCWGGQYLNEERGAIEYRIEEYDLEQSEKKIYKVLLEETSKMDEDDRFRLKDFVDVKDFQMTDEEKFKIQDGVLKSYNGYDKHLVIPEGIVAMERRALPYRAKEFESITIPKTLVEIPDGMFSGVKVKQINVAKENSRYYTENGLLIDRLSKTLVWAYGGSEIPADGSVVCIGRMAFEGRDDLKSMVIPATILEIGAGAFEGCSSLEKIVIPHSINKIDCAVFRDCKSLTDVYLPTSITRIENYAFAGCSGMVNFVIPKAVESIGDEAFSRCSNLREVVIPGSVVATGKRIFDRCINLKRVELPSLITKISEGMFVDCGNLSEVIISNSVTEIEGNAFRNCSGLKEINIPTSVVRIGKCAFIGCQGLVQIALPDSIMHMEESVFEGCTLLESVKLPSFLTVLPTSAFKNCTSLKNIPLPTSLLKIGKQAFSYCKALTTLVLPKGLIEIERDAFMQSGIVELRIPDSVKLLDDNALAGCRELREINMPEVFYADEERIFGGKLQREADGRYLVEGSSVRNFSGFTF